MSDLPYMKLYVGDASADISGLPLDAVGAYFALVLQTWRHGPIKVGKAEAILGRPLDSFPPHFMDLFSIDGDMLMVCEVAKQKGLSIGKSKQAASAANARWARERMRTHSDAHSGRNAKPMRGAMPVEVEVEVEAEVDGEVKGEGKRKIVDARSRTTTHMGFEEFREACLKVHKERQILGSDEAKAFFDYWTEGYPDTKPRYARQKVFDIAKRMATWNRNNFGGTRNTPAGALIGCEGHVLTTPSHAREELERLRAKNGIPSGGMLETHLIPAAVLDLMRRAS